MIVTETPETDFAFCSVFLGAGAEGVADVAAGSAATRAAGAAGSAV